MADKLDKKITITHINIRQSIFFLLAKLLIIDIFTSVIFFLFLSSLISPLFSNEAKLELITNNSYVFILVIFIKISLTLFIVLQWLNEYYEITTERIIHQKGVIFEHESKYLLEKVRAVKISQGIFGKIFNYGTLKLFDIRLNKYMDLYLIHNPMRYLRILEDLIPNLEEDKDVLRERKGEDKF